jgi:hypothetical protein
MAIFDAESFHEFLNAVLSKLEELCPGVHLLAHSDGSIDIFYEGNETETLISVDPRFASTTADLERNLTLSLYTLLATIQQTIELATYEPWPPVTASDARRYARPEVLMETDHVTVTYECCGDDVLLIGTFDMPAIR